MGHRTIEYTVLEDGTTDDHKVVDCSDEVFMSSSIQSAKSFYYKPKRVNGKVIKVEGVKNKFVYEIAK